jgi:hypothetical protein
MSPSTYRTEGSVASKTSLHDAEKRKFRDTDTFLQSYSHCRYNSAESGRTVFPMHLANNEHYRKLFQTRFAYLNEMWPLLYITNRLCFKMIKKTEIAFNLNRT